MPELHAGPGYGLVLEPLYWGRPHLRGFLLKRGPLPPYAHPSPQGVGLVGLAKKSLFWARFAVIVTNFQANSKSGAKKFMLII